MNIKKRLASTIALCLAGIPLHGAIIAAWDFGTTDGTNASFSPTVTADGVTVSDLTRGEHFTAQAVWLPSSKDAGAFNTSRGSTLGANAFAAFTITPSTPLDFGTIETYIYSQDRVRTFDVRYSLDNFATAGISLGSTDLQSSNSENFAGTLFSVDATSLQNVSQPIAFRIYITEPLGNFEQRGFGNVPGANYDIVVNSVPEPSTYAMIAALAALGGVVIMRRRVRR